MAVPKFLTGTGGYLNDYLIDNLKQISSSYKINNIFFHQGEQDLKLNTSYDDYRSRLKSIITSIRKLNIMAPIFISIASHCRTETYPNEVSLAQESVENKNESVYIAINSDLLISSEFRYDNCHFNFEGQVMAAKKVSEFISAYNLLKSE